MEYIFLAIIIFAVIIFPAVGFFKLKLISPSIIISVMFALSCIGSAIGEFYWNTESSIEPLTYVVILMGLSALVIGEVLIGATRNNKEKLARLKISTIHVNRWFFIATVVFAMITTVFLAIDIYNAVVDMGYMPSSLFDAAGYYNNHSFKHMGEDGLSVGSFVNQFLKISMILAFIFAYIFVNNIFAKDSRSSRKKGEGVLKKLKECDIKLLIPLAFMIVHGLLVGSRTWSSHALVALIAIYLVFIVRDGLSRKQVFALLRKVVLVVFVILMMFYFCMPLFGRSTKKGFMEYVTAYVGSPIPTLNKYIRESDNKDILIGYSTPRYSFSRLRSTLKGFEIVENGPEPLEFLKIGSAYSNVYTGFFRIFVDFGLCGVVAVFLIVGVLIGLLFRRLYNGMGMYDAVLFMLLSRGIFDMQRDDTLVNMIISITMITYVVYSRILIMATKKLIWIEGNNRKGIARD